jgi:NAD dependent epimerase/dehydratase family
MSRIFLAGAAGVIGRRLTPLLVAHGHSVWGATRSRDKSEFLRELGARPVLVDVFDAKALASAVLEAEPEIVIHQLTDLSAIQDPAKRSDALARNARIRDEGTRNLVAAARKAGARRLVAQSIAWAYAPGPRPYGEDDPLDMNVEGDRAVRAAERTRLPACLPYMSMRRPMPRCSQSTAASRAPSTSPIPTTRCRPTKPAPNWIGAPTSKGMRPQQRYRTAQGFWSFAEIGRVTTRTEHLHGG